jgi:ribosomal protein L37AE/L43A
MEKFGKGRFGKRLELKSEVTNGVCPICEETTVFVSLFSQIYRCITCGADTKQEVNGHIRFMPLATAGIGKKPIMKLMDDDGPAKH